MDIVLGVSMAPTVVRTVLVEGENADGVTVEQDNFVFAGDDAAATMSATDQVITTILDARDGATQAGNALTSTGVTWTDPVDAAALREALATRKVENVMLVSAFMAAAALAQMVGSATGNAHTALLFVEPDTATLAVVDSADGSITDVHKELISDTNTVTELVELVAGLDALETHPEHLFIVGSGVDIATLKPQLEAMTSIPVSAPEEPDTALAWGAALASANAPLFASSTAALAYAQDPATGAVDPYAVSPGYLAVPDVPPGTELGDEDLAYSAVPDEEADANTGALDEQAEANTTVLDLADDGHRERRPLLLVGTMLAVAVVTAILALEVSLALGIRPSAVALLPRPLQNILVPAALAPAPAPAPVSAPAPLVNHAQAPVAASPPAKAQMPAPPPAAPALPPAPAAPPLPVAVPPAPAVAPHVPAVAPHVPVVIPLPLPIPAGPPAPVNPFPLHIPGSPPSSLPGSPPPGHLPGSPPKHWPGSPPAHYPGSPQPPVSVPSQPAPVHMPVPVPQQQVVSPQAPVHASPQAPIQLPAPDEPPMHASVPDAPDAPGMPGMQAPEAPGMPGMQAPEAPGMPGMQAPEAPGMPGMQAPGMPSSGMPGSQGPGFGGFGGSHEGTEGPGGFGGFGGGSPGFGGFGGGHSFGGFGGGFGGGGFGGGFGGGGGHGGGGGGHR